jgi:hypothetical protein
MVNRSLDLIYIGILTKDGYFEGYTERKVRRHGGLWGGWRREYHHSFVYSKFSLRTDWEKIINDESTLRFSRYARFDDNGKGEERDDFVLLGRAALQPFWKRNKKQIRHLARLLIKMNINPEDRFRIRNFCLPEKKAPYQGKVIGTLKEISKWEI